MNHMDIRTNKIKCDILFPEDRNYEAGTKLMPTKSLNNTYILFEIFIDILTCKISRFLLITISILWITTSLSSTSASLQIICDKLYMTSNEISLSENEKKLVCDGQTKGWKKIPLNQKISQVKIYLQNKGYFEPKVVTNKKGTFIEIGKKSLVQKITFIDAPINFANDKYTHIKGKELTPENLGEIKSWALNKLASSGYPCAEIDGKASYLTGEVKLQINEKRKSYINELNRENTTRFNPTIFSRYDAFEIGRCLQQ